MHPDPEVGPRILVLHEVPPRLRGPAKQLAEHLVELEQRPPVLRGRLVHLQREPLVVDLQGIVDEVRLMHGRPGWRRVVIQARVGSAIAAARDLGERDGHHDLGDQALPDCVGAPQLVRTRQDLLEPQVLAGPQLAQDVDHGEVVVQVEQEAVVLFNFVDEVRHLPGLTPGIDELPSDLRVGGVDVGLG